MGWHICLIDKTDSHRLGTIDKLSEVSTNPSLSNHVLINQHKHSQTQTVTIILYSYCSNIFRASEGIKLKMEGKEDWQLAPFLFFVVQIVLKYSRIPHLSKPRSMTPLENNQSELWAALKSPLLSTKDSLQCLAKPPNEHYKSCNHFRLNNDTSAAIWEMGILYHLDSWLKWMADILKNNNRNKKKKKKKQYQMKRFCWVKQK